MSVSVLVAVLVERDAIFGALAGDDDRLAGIGQLGAVDGLAFSEGGRGAGEQRGERAKWSGSPVMGSGHYR